MTLFERRDKIVREIFKPAFKNEGFSISGTTFIKNEKDFVKVFNIQSSGFNLGQNVSFYLNMGIFFPVMYEMNGYEIPKNIKEYNCQIRFRTNSLTLRNQAYDLTPDTNFEELESLLKSDIENYIFPVFKKLKVVSDCITLVSELDGFFADCRPYVGLTFIKNNALEKGNKLVDEFIADCKNSGWAQTINDYRQRLLSDIESLPDQNN
jgi:hypothetical protein